MIRNSEHILYACLCFSGLNEQGYKNIATEELDNTAELCAAILARGISTQGETRSWEGIHTSD